jgi:RNA polymerase sigma-54 factor
LKPLRMQEIADEVGVHISTVSRAVAGKHAQTPRGVLPLKYFFVGGTMGEDGELQSQASIKQRIADLIRAEDAAKPLSDEDLAERLEKQDGVKIARRTVTKYRKALNLPSSSERRRF